MQVINCEQYSPEWWEVRLGLVTASRMKDLLAKGQGKMRARLLHDLVSERVRGLSSENYYGHHMERGHEAEQDAVTAYGEYTDLPITRPGFVVNHGIGCSPDCLVGDEGGAEIKTRLPGLQIELLLSGKVPPEHKAQIQASIWVCERKWWDFVSYCPGLRLFVKRVFRDDEYIEAMKKEVESFHKDMQEAMNAV